MNPLTTGEATKLTVDSFQLTARAKEADLL